MALLQHLLNTQEARVERFRFEHFRQDVDVINSSANRRFFVLSVGLILPPNQLLHRDLLEHGRVQSPDCSLESHQCDRVRVFHHRPRGEKGDVGDGDDAVETPVGTVREVREGPDQVVTDQILLGEMLHIFLGPGFPE